MMYFELMVNMIAAGVAICLFFNDRIVVAFFIMTFLIWWATLLSYIKLAERGEFK